MQNPNCDNSKCTSPTSEVRVLPTGGDGNMIICRSCFRYEMAYRTQRKRETGSNNWHIVTWESLKVYDPS